MRPVRLSNCLVAHVVHPTWGHGKHDRLSALCVHTEKGLYHFLGRPGRYFSLFGHDPFRGAYNTVWVNGYQSPRVMPRKLSLDAQVHQHLLCIFHACIPECRYFGTQAWYGCSTTKAPVHRWPACPCHWPVENPDDPKSFSSWPCGCTVQIRSPIAWPPLGQGLRPSFRPMP